MSRRKYVESQIKNVHDSQKWFWVVLAGYSVISAIKWILEYWASVNIDSIFPFDEFIAQATPFGYFVVLISVIYRFYLGDNRILDHYYDSIPKSILETEDDKFWTYIGRLTPFQILVDSTGRIIQYLFIVAAALSLHEIEYFPKIIASLLLFNFLYSMWFVVFVEPVAEGVTDDDIRKVMKFSEYRTIWAINNIWCSVFVFLLLSIDAEHFELIIILSFLANSIIDVSLCREVYFPNYSKFRCKIN